MPKCQPARWVPYVVRKEIAQNMKEKPENNVIKTSSSPCASSDVFVQDGTLYFCVDYQHLNSVSKLDKFCLMIF